MIASQQYVKRKEKAMMKTEALNLTQEWDKTFPKSDKVDQLDWLIRETEKKTND